MHKTSLYTVLACLGIGLVIVGVGEAQTITRNEDFTDNNLDWDQNPDLLNASTRLNKYGEGIDDTTGEHYESNHSELNTFGNVAFTFAYFVNEQDFRRTLYIAQSSDTSTTVSKIQVGQGSIRYSYTGDDGLIQECIANFVDQNKAISAWVEVSAGTAVTDTSINIKAFKFNGATLQHTTCFRGPDPVEQNGLNAQAFAGGNSLEAFELRVFNQSMSDSTLDDIADPTNDAFTQEKEGTELAYWPFERLNIGDPGETQSINEIHGMVMNSELTIKENSRIVIRYANRSHVPLSPEDMPNLSISTIRNDNVRWWNFTSESWSPKIHRQTMNFSSIGDFSFEQNVTLFGTNEVTIEATAQFSDGTDTFNATVTDRITLQQKNSKESFITASVFEIDGWKNDNVAYALLSFILLVVAAKHGWVGVALAGIFGVAHAIFKQHGVQMPIDFSFVLLFAVLMVVLHMAIAKFGSQHKGEGGAT